MQNIGPILKYFSFVVFRMIDKFLYASAVTNTLTKLKVLSKKVREKSRECHNHKPQPFKTGFGIPLFPGMAS